MNLVDYDPMALITLHWGKNKVCSQNQENMDFPSSYALNYPEDLQ